MNGDPQRVQERNSPPEFEMLERVKFRPWR